MRRAQVALVVVGLVTVPYVSELLTVAGWGSVFVAGGVVLVGVVVADIALKRRRRERNDGEDEEVWGIIPDWQYEGRLVEAGGLTRSEQSEAIEEVQAKADELERDRR